MDENRIALAQIISAELTQPVPSEAAVLAAEICQRHGTAVAAILFYGSCLRTKHIEDGVLDFYVLVDSYRAAYSSRVLAWLNAALPPNVFYLEITDGQKTVRAKYAVISTADFDYAASPRSVHSIVWARFCQPTRLVYVRDENAQTMVVHTMVQSVLTMVAQMAALLAVPGDTQGFRSEHLWQRGFEETYRTELRPEKPETIRQLYDTASDRYDSVAREALLALERRGVLQVRMEGQWLRVTMDAQQRRRLRLDWKLRRPLAKAFYIVRLLKSAATFRDWLPYVLWKLGRHTGVWIEPTARQRRHPILWGWPLILRFLLRRDLR